MRDLGHELLACVEENVTSSEAEPLPYDFSRLLLSAGTSISAADSTVQAVLDFGGGCLLLGAWRVARWHPKELNEAC